MRAPLVLAGLALAAALVLVTWLGPGDPAPQPPTAVGPVADPEPGPADPSRLTRPSLPAPVAIGGGASPDLREPARDGEPAATGPSAQPEGGPDPTPARPAAEEPLVLRLAELLEELELDPGHAPAVEALLGVERYADARDRSVDEEALVQALGQLFGDELALEVLQRIGELDL